MAGICALYEEPVLLLLWVQIYTIPQLLQEIATTSKHYIQCTLPISSSAYTELNVLFSGAS